MISALFALLTALIIWLVPFMANAPAVFVEMHGSETRGATILFGGDMMFDRSIRVAADENGDEFLFSCITDTLESADLVVANLEGPITTHAPVSVNSIVGTSENMTFTFPTTTASLLKRHNISLVNLGNNHIMNFSREGLLQTKGWLDAVSVQYFGDPDAVESERVVRPTINGILFSFVNWSDWTSDKTDHTVEQVRREAESGRVVVVYAHWGEEYVESTPQMRHLAHSFVDSGAAIVVGSHPHIIQEHEVYNGKNIYYSLGNFIFDQYFSEDVRNGLLLRVFFDAAGVVSMEEIPIYLERDQRTCLKEVE